MHIVRSKHMQRHRTKVVTQVSEAAINRRVGCITHAVARAIGTRVAHMPMTPERIMAAIKAAQGEASPTMLNYLL